MKNILLLSLILIAVSPALTLSQNILSNSDTSGIANTSMEGKHFATIEHKPFAVWNAQMFIGNGFNYERGIGFGVRGNFEFSNTLFVGVSIVYHIGLPKSVKTDGYGPSVFLGPEIGKRIVFSSFTAEIVCAAGQLTYEKTPVYSIPYIAQGTVETFFISPGIGVTTRTETGSAGIHLRYVVVKDLNMFGLYFSIGI
ncbi:MAG: hypothetical protein WCW35_11265 [Bacteroidota bacterium]